MLNSELKGEIEHPGYYIYSNDPQRKQVLDLLMMTQGWRQYILNDTLKIRDNQKQFLPESGIRFSGTVRRLSTEGKPVKATVTLIYSNKEEQVYNETETDEQGHFAFDHIDLMDSTLIVIQAKTFKNRKLDKNELLTPNPNFYIVMDSIPALQEPIKKTNSLIFNENLNEQKTKDTEFTLQQGDILIGNVDVTAKKIDPKAEKRTMYFEPSNHLDFKEIRKYGGPRNILEAIEGQFPGVKIDGDNISIGGDNRVQKDPDAIYPLFLLDGLPISKIAILAFPIERVDFIDVLKRSKTIIYGSAGSHGVIAVYTLNASDILKNSVDKEHKSILKFYHPGYSKARKFYEPLYTSQKSLKEAFDYGSTVYWNPNLILDENKTFKISFSSTDLPAYYKVDLQGITTDGIPIHVNTILEVK